MKSIILKPHEVRALQDKGEVLVVRAVTKKWLPLVEDVLRVNGKWVFDTLEYELTTPFGVVGERRYVREKYRAWCPDGKWLIRYEADNEVVKTEVSGDQDLDDIWLTEPKKFKMFPPLQEWASRFTIENTRIDCRQVQSVSEEEANGAGIKKLAECDFVSTIHPIKGSYQRWPSARVAFEEFWQSQHKKPPLDWDSNPWAWFVWVRMVDKAEETPAFEPDFLEAP